MPATNKISPETSAWLDWIRALAAALVFFGHMRSFCFEDFSHHAGPVPLALKAFYFISSQAHAAVIVFFVLSGFLVGGNVLNEFRQTGKLKIKNYVVARVSRIHSVLLPALVLGASADWIGLRVIQSSSVYQEGHFHHLLDWNVAETLNATTFLANVACLQTIFTPVLGSNGPLWSLANEFWYYFLFPAALTVVWPQTSWLKRIPALLLTLALLWMLGRMIDTYFLFWLAGVGVRLVPKTVAPPIWASALVFIGILALMHLPLNHAAVLSTVEVDAMVTVFFSIMLWSVAQRPLSMPAWLAKGGSRLAASSYTLYACHFPLIVLMSAMLMQYGGWSLPNDVLNPQAWMVYAGFFLIPGGICWGLSLVTEHKHHQLKRWLMKFV